MINIYNIETDYRTNIEKLKPLNVMGKTKILLAIDEVENQLKNLGQIINEEFFCLTDKLCQLYFELEIINR